MEETKSIGHLNQEDQQTQEFTGTVATYTGPMSIHPSAVLALKGNLDIHSYLSPNQKLSPVDKYLK